MSEGRVIKSGGRAADEAAGWFARLHDDAATGEDWLAFETWLAAAPTHVQAYERLERIWVDLDREPAVFLRALDAAALRPAARRPRPDPVRHHPTRRVWLMAGAGAIAAALVLAVEIDNRPAGHPLMLRTAPGETRTFTLADGSKLNLNAGSVVRVEFTRRRRAVVMGDAEAVFDVAHDPKRPFVITSGDREVRVVGTLFNLRQRDGSMMLSVRRGVVEVRPADSTGARPTRVTQGQQLSHRDGGPMTLAQDGRAETAFAWTSGQLIYRDQPLGDVAADLTRRFGVTVRAADPATASLRFSGVLVLDNEPEVLSRIEAFTPVRAERTDAGIVLRRR